VSLKILKPLDRPIKSKILWAFDTEDNQKGQTLICNLYDGTEHHTFKNPKDVIFFLQNYHAVTETRETIYIFCTNLEYDLCNLIKENFFSFIDCRFWGSRIISARLRKSKFVFFDSLNLWGISVEKMGKLINLPKLEADYKKMAWNRKNITYCRRDSEISQKFAVKSQEILDSMGCELKATLPSCSLDLFKRKYLHDMIHVPPEKIIGLLRKALHGGRTEIFNNQPQTGNIWAFDFNSLYASVMLENHYPCPNGFKLITDKKEVYTAFNSLNPGVYNCRVSFKGYLPVLPLVYRDINDSDKLCFPQGEFTGTWTWPELSYALHIGYKLIKVNWAITYRRSYPYFKEFCTDILKRRSNSRDDFSRGFYKMFCNSLFGKFSQRNEKTVVKKYCGEKLARGTKIIDGYYYKNVKGEYPEQSNFIWSIYTTAYARIKHHKAMQYVIDQGGKLLYCDTDSIHFMNDKPIFKHSLKYGELKLEGKIAYAWYKLPKLYFILKEGEEYYKAKGVKNELAKEFFYFKECTVFSPIRLRESFRRNIKANVWVNKPKSMKSEYTKRICDPKTGESVALTLK